MSGVYGRDLDLNLLRVFAVVAETGSVTDAASRLYLTQPAVSAALRRLATTIGAPLFVRRGRGLALTARGTRLQSAIRPHLQELIDAALAPTQFDPATTERTFRLGLSDAAELWLLPRLLRVLEREAPGMRIISVPVQFRTVGAALAAGLDAAVTVADELPATIRRIRLFSGGFVALFDPRQLRIRRMTDDAYFAADHVIVSYNSDLRGIVEDVLQRRRRIRCSVSSFASIGSIIEGSRLVATIPEMIATQIRAVRPHLRALPVPFKLPGAWSELLWPAPTDDDDACKFMRARIAEVAKER
ncbi:MAG: LysR family transcriptional regulator [Kofleriaceae bacterium]|nr:LysR family transcriptional regulator [Kofleriaceae bacterium]